MGQIYTHSQCVCMWVNECIRMLSNYNERWICWFQRLMNVTCFEKRKRDIYVLKRKYICEWDVKDSDEWVIAIVFVYMCRKLRRFSNVRKSKQEEEEDQTTNQQRYPTKSTASHFSKCKTMYVQHAQQNFTEL